MLLDKKFQFVKYFEIDTYLDSKSRVASFYHFLMELQNKQVENLSISDLKIFQMNIAKIKDYHDEVIQIVKGIINIDKISFDMLRLSRIRDEYCITNDVAKNHDQILDFFLSISDKVPEYIKFFQIKGVNTLQATFEFLETCPIEMEIFDIEDVTPNIDVSPFQFSQTLSKSLEKVTVSYTAPKKILEFPDMVNQLKNEQLKFYFELMFIICKNETHNVVMGLKLNNDEQYERPVILYFKNCSFNVYDNVQGTIKKYYSSYIQVLVDGGSDSTNMMIDKDSKLLNVYSPEYLSVFKPRFIKQSWPEIKCDRSFVSLNIIDV